MFFWVVAVESSSVRCLGLLSASISQCSELLPISLAGKDGINDPAKRQASDVFDNMMQL